MTRSLRSSNAEYQVLTALRTNRQKRNRENAFVVEGVRNVDAALTHGWMVRSALVNAASKRSAWADSVCARVDDVVEVAGDLFSGLTDRDDTPELVLVVEKRHVSIDAVVVTGDTVVTVLDRPTYPGNIGSILRTCDALGSAALFTLGHGADPYDPQSVRASTGSFFAVPVVELENPAQLRSWADQRGVTLVATDEVGDTSIDNLPTGALALLLGNETVGLSRGLRDVADSAAAIAMRGTASSLNVAAAHAIALHAAVSR